MMLNLINLNNNFKKINTGKRKEVYCDDANNMIVFRPYDKDCTTETICNGIKDKAYDYLINKLNTSNGIVAYCTQVNGTTSDYDIFYDLNVRDLSNSKNVNYIIDAIHEHLDSCTGSKVYKYCDVSNGIVSKIKY